MLDLRPDILAAIKAIVYTNLPDCEIRAFGSRVNNSAKPYSDIDISLVTDRVIDDKVLAIIEQAFENSNIPIRVEVCDWHRLTADFQAIIAEHYLVL